MTLDVNNSCTLIEISVCLLEYSLSEEEVGFLGMAMEGGHLHQHGCIVLGLACIEKVLPSTGILFPCMGAPDKGRISNQLGGGIQS